MSANLAEERRIVNPKRFHVPHTVNNRKTQWKPSQRLPFRPVADDEEVKFVTRAVMWIVVLGVTPLILFHIVNLIYPELLLVPITPHQLRRAI